MEYLGNKLDLQSKKYLEKCIDIGWVSCRGYFIDGFEKQWQSDDRM